MRPSGSKLLFDTNAVIAWLNRESGLAAAAARAEDYYTTFANVGELLYGVRNSSSQAENERALRKGLRYFTILFPDDETLYRYADLSCQLKKRGMPIPHNDLWIAALALQHQLPLLTVDKHSKPVDGLELVGWENST